MQIENIISDILESNTYILKKDGEALIVDCGCTLDKVENAVGENKVVGVLLTHGHYDHSINCNEYAKKFGCKIYANAMVAETVTDFEANYSDDKSVIEDLSNFVFIEKDMTLSLGNFQVECISAPGHCHCCECYLVEGNLFAGDVLFARGVGRMDLKSSSKEDMYSSLLKLEKLDFDKVFSGHGESTLRDAQLKNINIFKKFLSR